MSIGQQSNQHALNQYWLTHHRATQSRLKLAKYFLFSHPFPPLDLRQYTLNGHFADPASILLNYNVE
jgi:hypothetical protein